MTDADDASPSADASAAPTRQPGGRTRAGNGMGRARAGILSGAAICIGRFGTRKTTMGDIAKAGGVAKATLYNHFRTKSDVYAALAAAEVDALLERVTAVGVPAGSVAGVTGALTTAAAGLSEHPLLRALAASEPDLVASLTVPGTGPTWDCARAAVTQQVTLAQAAGALHPRHDAREVVSTVLRWVLSHALWPAPGEACAAAAHQLVQGLVAEPAVPAAAGSAAESGAPEASAAGPEQARASSPYTGAVAG